jgi:hypothetical protein
MKRRSLILLNKLAQLTSNKRELRFKIELCIHELTHIPQPNGTLFAKWKTPGGVISDETSKQRIQNHTVRWAESFEFECSVSVDNASNIVDSCPVRISIRQETNNAAGFERIGVVIVDLAEYVSSRESTRRYLLQMSNLNSNLKITVRCQQTSGDPMFKCRTAQTHTDDDTMLGMSEDSEGSFAPASLFTDTADSSTPS